MTKKILRQQFLHQRQQLSLEFIQTKSQQISEQLLNAFDFNSINVLHTFLPIINNHEINTWLIIKKIWDKFPQMTVTVPKSNFINYTMQSYILQKETQICENRWHIPEPENAQPIDACSINMTLLPLICFDECGFRVGYGKGFYDRFLAQCRQDVIKVGLSLFPPVTQIEGIHEFDVKMDYCITEKAIFRF